MSEEQKTSTAWAVPLVRYAPQKAEQFTVEELEAWETAKKSSFSWLYDFENPEDTVDQILWKKHVSYMRKMMIENIDLALYEMIEAVRKSRWHQLTPSVIVPSGAISVPQAIFVNTVIEDNYEEDNGELMLQDDF